MKIVRLAVGITIYTAGGTAQAITLDTEGGIDQGPIYCTASSWEGWGNESYGEYHVEGSCNVGYLGSLPVKAGAGYEDGEAQEHIVIYGDAGKTTELWEIVSSSTCTSNPFIGGGKCTPEHIWSNTPWPVWPEWIPLMWGKMKHLEETASGGQALEEGQETEDLSDWDPYPEGPDAQCVGIAKPGNDVYILASDPPGFNAEVVLVPKVRAPSSIAGEFQKAELATQMGDISTDKPYPKSWHTIPAPMSPGSPQPWSALQDAPGSTNSKVVALHTGASNAPFTAGYYRVRVKLMQGDCGWEPWRYFWVTTGPAHEIDKTPARGSAVTFGAKARTVKPRVKAPVQAKADQITVARPKLWIDTTQGPVMTEPELNKLFGVSLSIKNTGQAQNKGVFQGKIALSCTPVGSRGGCRKLSSNVQIPPVPPGQSRVVSVPAAFRITEPGNYKITVKVDPAPTGRMLMGLTGSWSRDVSIASPISPIKRDTVKKGQPRTVDQTRTMDTPEVGKRLPTQRDSSEAIPSRRDDDAPARRDTEQDRGSRAN